MATPNRAARRRAARDAAQLQQQDPAFVEQMQAQQREQAINGLAQQYETAMAALGRANRDLGLFEQEVTRLHQLGGQLEEENTGLLADLEASDVDIADACTMIDRLLNVASDAESVVCVDARSLLERLRPSDDPAPEPAPPALEVVPEPDAASNGAGDVTLDELAPVDMT